MEFIRTEEEEGGGKLGAERREPRFFQTYTKCDAGSADCRQSSREIFGIFTLIDLALICVTSKIGQPRRWLT